MKRPYRSQFIHLVSWFKDEMWETDDFSFEFINQPNVETKTLVFGNAGLSPGDDSWFRQMKVGVVIRELDESTLLMVANLRHPHHDVFAFEIVMKAAGSRCLFTTRVLAGDVVSRHDDDSIEGIIEFIKSEFVGSLP